MKKTLLILISLVLLGYLVFAAIYFQDASSERVCGNFDIVVKDSLEKRFIDTKDIDKLLKAKKLNPKGKKVRDINTLEIQKAIETNKLIKSVDVFIAQNGDIVAEIEQRNPVLRVISDTEGSYYIDNNRERMPTSLNFTVYVPIATGKIDEALAKNELYDFAIFLSQHPKWDAWVSQIVVDANNEIALVPRVGDFKVILGDLTNFTAKLAKLTLFIEKGLNVVGWNRYSEINLTFDNQVVCTKTSN